MFALGFMNVVASIFQSYPLTGSFSRSAINNEVGAQSQLASIVSPTVVGLTLLVLTPLFKYTPQSALAAIIWYAVIFLIEPGKSIRYVNFSCITPEIFLEHQCVY